MSKFSHSFRVAGSSCWDVRPWARFPPALFPPLISHTSLWYFKLEGWKLHNIINDLQPIVSKQGLWNPQEVSFESHDYALTSSFTACALIHSSFHKIVRKSIIICIEKLFSRSKSAQRVLPELYLCLTLHLFVAQILQSRPILAHLVGIFIDVAISSVCFRVKSASVNSHFYIA